MDQRKTRSGQDAFNRIGFFDTSQPLIQALELIGEEPMINSQAMENGGIDVADMNRIFGDVVAEIVRLAVNHPAFDAAASHPHGEAARMMISPIIILGKLALAINGSPE